MNIRDAKNLNLVSLLSNLGFEPQQYKPENIAWYFSPFRNENTPSFKIDTYKNTWYDFGEGIGGDTINFIQELYKINIASALHFLNSKEIGKISFFTPPAQIYGKEKESHIKIYKELPLTNFGILKYLELRCIPLDVASKYCKEIHYTCHGKNYIAIGFKNDSGGYELRSANFKGKSCDAMTTIEIPGSYNMNIFEGFFDFLSAIKYFKVTQPASTTLILNSTNKTAYGVIDRLASMMHQYKGINLYFDNDPVSMTGQKAVTEIKKLHPNVYDCSHLYKGYKDFNEFIQNSSTQ